MRFKLTGHGAYGCGYWSPQHPDAPLGNVQERVDTIDVTDIPPDTPMHVIQHMLKITGIWMGAKPVRWTIRYAELGLGKIVYLNKEAA